MIPKKYKPRTVKPTIASGVKSVGGFVEDEKLGAVQEGARQPQALEIARRKRANFSVRVRSEEESLDDFVHHFWILDSVQAPRHVQIFAHGQFRIGRRILDEMPHPRPRPASTRTDGLVQHFDVPRARADHPQKRADGRGLARAVETEEAVDLADADAQVHRGDGGHIAEAFGELVGFNGKSGHGKEVADRVYDWRTLKPE